MGVCVCAWLVALVPPQQACAWINSSRVMSSMASKQGTWNGNQTEEQAANPQNPKPAHAGACTATSRLTSSPSSAAADARRVKRRRCAQRCRNNALSAESGYGDQLATHETQGESQLNPKSFLFLIATTRAPSRFAVE